LKIIAGNLLIRGFLASKSSNSDIVIEEDLAELFGRSVIASNMAASFRTVIAAPHPPVAVCERIALFNGAGPTVIRALTEPPYFAMVVQCESDRLRSL
jgi:hypothetical protein